MTKSSNERDNDFYKVYQQAPTGIAIMDWQGVVQECNPAYCTMLGYTEEELRHINFASLFHQDDREPGLVELRRLQAKEIPSFEIENRHIRKSGELAWVRTFVSVLSVRSGEPTHLMVQVTDITRHKNAVAALKESEERFRALVNASSYVVYRMGPDWSEMRELDGKGFIVDTPVASRIWLNFYIDPDDQPRVMAEAIQTKSMFELEHRVRRVDGTLAWTLSRAVPLLDPNGEITEWFGAASDVTERKSLEEALRESEECFRIMADGIPQMIWVTNTDAVLQFVNRAWSDFFGIARQHAKVADWPTLVDLLLCKNSI
jgi:PAS domain S-box-containing protein